MRNSKERKVYLPLERLDKCAVCGITNDIRLCSRCGERIYCGAQCQKTDWPEHKRVCGKTDRISLTSFYPFLALLAEISRMHPERPVHPAVVHEILNSPNPGVLPTLFHDGSSAKLVMLGDPVPLSYNCTARWWPTGQTDQIRKKLTSRFLREGNSLSILTSICLALLSEMYTTTYVPKEASPDGKPQPRLRLKYRSSPIADFGIAKGSADVKTQDRFAYFSAPDLRFWMGEDPNEHYWLWFRTIRGEEVTLDLDMYTFNMCTLIPTEPYRNSHCPPSEVMRYAPAYLYEREFQKRVIPLTQERSRASVLRDPALQRAIRTSGSAIGGEDVRAIHQWMERLAGKQIPRTEVDLMMKWTINNLELLGATLANREWTRFPESPSFAIDADPGEMDNEPGETDGDWYKFTEKWTKKYKKGKISREAFDKAHREWKNHVKPSK